jgi:hypothetical protein
LDPSGQKGIFVGYSDTLKAYRICIPGHRKVEINRDVTFDENVAFSKSKKIREEEAHEEENEVPKVQEAVEPKEVIPKDHDMVEPQKTSQDTFSQEKTSLGTRSYQRCRKNWCHREIF